MALYDEMQKVAQELLGDPEFNQGGVGKIEYVRIVPGNGPVDNPGPSTTVVTPLDAAARGASFKYVQAGLAAAGDLQVTAAIVPGLIPSGADFIDIDGVRYKIMQILNRPSAGTKVVWTFIIQRGERSNRTVS